MAGKSTLSSGHALAVLLIILLTAGLLAFFSLQSGHDWGGDFALYLRQANSLLDGSSELLLAQNTYAMENSSVGPPSNPQIGPHLYPWGFPLLLLPLVASTGYSLIAVKGYLILFFLLALLVNYYLFVPRLGRAYSLMLTALLAFNPFLLTFSDIIVSDIPFLFFSLLSLLFVEKTLGYRPYFVNKTVTYLLTGFLLFFSFLIRTNGIVLLGVLGVGHLIKWGRPLLQQQLLPLLRKEWKELLPYGAFAFFLLLAKVTLPSGSGSHLLFLKAITPGKLAWNLMYYIELPADFFRGVLFPMLLYGITVPFLVLGIWRRIRMLPDGLYLVFCAASMIIFVLWPPVQGLRFIFPLLPFYLYFVFKGLQEVQTAFWKAGSESPVRWVPVFSLVLGGLFLFGSLKAVTENFPERRMAEGPYTEASQEMLSVLKKETTREDVIVFFKPRVLSFLLDRQSLRVTRLAELEAGKGDYLLYYKPVNFGQLLEEEYSAFHNQLRPVFENEEYSLYNLKEWRQPALQPLAAE